MATEPNFPDDLSINSALVQDQGYTVTTPDPVASSGLNYSFAVPNAPKPLSEAGVDILSKKYSFASGGEITVAEAKDKLNSNAETDLQQWMAYKRQLDNNRNRRILIEQTAMSNMKEGDRFALLKELSQLDLNADPATAYAEEFASKAISSIPGLIQASTLSEAAKNPEALDSILSHSERVISKRELFGRLFLDFDQELKESSFFGGFGYNLVNASIDTAKLFIPGLSWNRFREVAAKEDLQTSYWKSNNIENVIQKIYNMPPKEGYEEAKRITAELLKGNSYDAITFMHGLQSFGTSDKFLNDIETVVDATIIGGAAVRLFGMLHGAQKAFGATYLSSHKLAEATGDLGQAARMQVVNGLTEQAAVTGSRSSFQRVLDTVPTIFNVDNVLTNASNLSAEATNRLRQSLNRSVTDILSKYAGSLNIRRIDDTSAALAEGLAEAETYVRSTYRNLNDAIVDIRPVSADAGLANIAGVEARVGKGNYEEFVNSIKNNTLVNPAYRFFETTVRGPLVDRAVREGVLETFDRIRPAFQKPDGTWVEAKTIKGYRLADNAKLSSTQEVRSGIEVIVGTKAATFFDTEAQAINHAKNYYALKEGSYTVKAEGDKFYLSIFKQVDESSPRVQAALATELNQPEPRGVWNFIGRRLGATEDIMGNSMSTARKNALFQSSDLLDTIAKTANEKLGTLRKESRQNLYRFIDAQRRFEQGDEVGRFSTNLGEFETEWRSMYNRYPTEREADAYFHYTMLSDMDWTINNANLYTQKALQGYRSFGLSTDKVRMKDLFLDGKIVPEIPNIDRTYPNIIVWSNRLEGLRTITDLAEVRQWLDQGYRIIKLSSNSGHDIARFPGIQPHLPKGRIDYVLAQNFDEGPLRWDQLAYKPGGHRLYTDDWYVSAAKVFTGNRTGEVFSAYAGDFNISSARTRAQAQQFVNVLERARELLRVRDDLGLAEHIRDNFPHGLTEARFRSLYDDEVLNINEPFRLRRRDTTIADVYQLDRHYPNFVDQTKSGHHMDEGLVQYSSRRSQLLGAVEGTSETPLVRIGEGRLLDPMQTLSKAVNSIARNAFMEDVRIKHSTEYMARFGDLLDIKEPLEATLNPFKYLLDGKFKEGAIDAERLAAAKAYRRSALEFLGIQQETDTAARTLRDRALDAIFNRFGERGVDFVEPYLLHRVNDPAAFFRSLAFHKNIGLFNWSAYVTQMMQFTTMAGIGLGQGPTGLARAGQGLAWGMYQRMLPMASESVQRAIYERAGQWGANFAEATEGWRRSGLATVGGEIAYLDDFIDQKVIKSSVGNFLDLGRTFFDAGERHARQTAWNIAYLDWRSANPRATMTDSVIRDLVQRTDLLTGNMTRASQSYWQRGAMSVPAQFNNWQIRMSEQMFGDRLTRAEKSSLVMLNSTLYGIPTGVTSFSPLGFVRWHEGISEYFRNNGLEIRDKAYMDLMMNGIMPHIMEFATGDRWNVGQKYGPPGKNFLYEALYNDEKSWLAVVAGASGDAINSVYKVTQPLIYTLKSLVGNKDEVYPLTFSDFRERISKLLPTMDMAERAYVALATGQYISRNNRERNVAEIDNYKGWFIGLLGLTPDAAVQTYDKSVYLKDIKKIQDKYAPEIQDHLLKALRSKDDTTYHDNMKQAKVLMKLGQFTPREEATLIHRIMSQNTDLTDSVNRRLAERGPKYLEMYYRELERNKK